jgi:TRAP-type C4-dicarboxylate transport system permease small subunit
MMNKKRILHFLGNLDIYIADLSLAVLTLLTCYGVVMRYVLGKPLTWLEEVQLFCMVWVVFSASGAAFRTKNHVAIEMLVEAFPAKVQKVIEKFIDVIVVAVLGYLLYQCIGYVNLFVKSERSTNMLAIPYWLIYGIAPVACVDMIVSYFYAKYISKPKSAIEEAIQ